METVILSANKIIEFIKAFGLNKFMDESIKCIEKGFLDYSEGKIQRVRRIGFLFQGNTVESMPCRRVGKAYCFKIVNFHQKNVEKSLPSVMSTSLYLDETTGFLKAIIDTTLLTAIRTGATTGLATKYLAPNATKIGLIGTGVIGQTSLHAISRVCNIKKIFIWDINQEVLYRFKKQMERLLNIHLKIQTPEKIIKNSEVIVTCTYGNEIVIKKEFIKIGERKLLNAIGGDTPGKSEIDPFLYKKAKIIVDFKEQAIREGDVSNPIKQRVISKTDIFAELHEIISKKRNLTKEDKLIIFDSTGDPIEDLVIVELLLEKKRWQSTNFIFKPKRKSDLYYDFIL